MARDLAPKYKRSRREGVELHPDLDKAGSDRSPLSRRRYAPGVHGGKRPAGKMSNYGQQLREKQKAKRIYGLLERQFRNYYQRALRKKGDTGEVMLSLLERRLDNIVYRLGFAKTRPAARQLVTHGHILVNNKKAAVPSLLLAVGSEVALKDKITQSPHWQEQLKAADKKIGGWLMREKHQGKVLAEPDLSEPKLAIDMTPIIEFYSR